MSLRLMLRVAVSVIALCILRPEWVDAQARFTCQGRYNEYHFCKIDLDNKPKIVNRLSWQPCIEDRTWGWSSRGAWVKDGCRAEFETRPDKKPSGAAKGAAIAVGMGALAAVVIASQHNEKDSDAAAPNWAVGTFDGIDPVSSREIIMTISPSGVVSWNSPYGNIKGTWVKGQSQFQLDGGGAWTVVQEGTGVRVFNTADRSQEIPMRRLR